MKYLNTTIPTPWYFQSKKFEIEVAETKYSAEGSINCFYDPGREKILVQKVLL